MWKKKVKHGTMFMKTLQKQQETKTWYRETEDNVVKRFIIKGFVQQ